MKQAILDLNQVTNQDLILTPNRRLAAWIQRDHNQLQLASGKSAWKPVLALPLDAWVAEQFSHSSVLSSDKTPVLLSDAQSRVIWQQQLIPLIQPGQDLEGIIRLCSQARELIFRWQLQQSDWDVGDTEETLVFSQAHKAYKTYLERRDWIDAAALTSWLLANRPESWQVNGKVYFHGFNDLGEPQLVSQIDSFGKNGAEVLISQQKRFKSRAATVAFPEVQHQFRAALTWALEQHQENPEGRIGVVVPNLEQQRHLLERIGADLQAANPGCFAGSWHSRINITAGVPLAKYPIVAHLLLLLRGLASSLPLLEWSVLVKSPFLQAGVKEFEIRDQFLIWLRSKNRHQLSIREINSQWNLFRDSQGFTESSSLFQIDPILLDTLRKQKPVSDWVLWLRRVLSNLGWLKERSLDSTGYQVSQRLKETLRTLSQLDAVIEAVDYERFVSELNILARTTSFQVQTETAPIQVMGALEAAAINFDMLWVCECENQQWPQVAQPNAMLSRATLRRYQMPGSGPERELTYARNMLDGFEHAAPNVIFSWGQYSNDAQLMLTPILSELPCREKPHSKLNLESRQALIALRSSQIDDHESDDRGRPLDSSRSKGGSGVIRAQSLCPFKAYAEYRLSIRDGDELQEGVKASDRGSLVHKVMEQFWRRVGSSNQLELLLTDSAELDNLLNEIITIELERFKGEVHLQPEALYDLERQRTFQSVRQWLISSEGARAPFTVANVEKQQLVELAGLQLTLTVDRIDILENDNKVIVDYKTGYKHRGSMLGTRPEEPQLPLYALLDDVATKGIVFGIIKPEKAEWQGFIDENVQFESKPSRQVVVPGDGWDTQVEEWRDALEVLASEFKQGQAQVMPLNQNVCTYCHLSPVCRIKEQHRDGE